ncbi:MAG: hypothetical protein ACOC44_05200, partial [Promethearchaeia archaeon]
MERKNLEKVFSIIQQIEKRNKDLVELLSQTPSLSRDEILENIAQHVVNKNLSELGFSPEGSC